jgi:hypothetical protein
MKEVVELIAKKEKKGTKNGWKSETTIEHGEDKCE